jgi:exodeoxyribonuclease VII large subunit
MDLFEDTPAPSNAPEFTVSEISNAVKRVIEGEFGHVRVRGEISRVSRPASGHLYFDLKDDRSVIASVCWKGQAGRLTVRPEEGMEVVAVGRLTTFPGQSKYQLVVENLEPAGAGALMLMLERRKAALAAEGLFDASRKKPIPYLPEVVGVITSPSGAVIRDILHRLRDRFPRRVVIWPVAVQGEKCAPEVAAAIRGFNAMPQGGPIPRPDVLIVARGGGSIEDLWGFNEEIVVRAAAASRIPLISAVGHETDTTLIDHAADLRAPTPTAAAELAVPVRADLIAWAAEQGARLARAARTQAEMRRQRLRDLARGLGRPEALTEGPRQRLDSWGERLGPALSSVAFRKRARLAEAGLRPAMLARAVEVQNRHLAQVADRLQPALEARTLRGRERLDGLSARIGPAMLRLSRDRKEAIGKQCDELARMAERMARAWEVSRMRLAERLATLDRARQTLGHAETLARGFAVVRAGGRVVTTRALASAAPALEIEFRDGRLAVRPDGEAPNQSGPKPGPAGGSRPAGQGSLF